MADFKVVTGNGTVRFAFPRRARTRGAFCAGLTAFALFVGGLLIVVVPSAGTAATSGWSVSTVPGSGVDDVLLGTACTGGTQCFSTGISLGDLSSPTSVPTPIIDVWDGSRWTYTTGAPLSDGVEGGLFNVTCASPIDCWAVGAQLEAGGNGNSTGALVENWNGSAWSVVPTPTPDGNGVVGAFLQGVTCTSPSNCIAVGYTTDINGGNLNDLIEQWNGSSWMIVPGAPTGQTFDQLMRVDCLSPDNCWAVGNAGPVQQNPNFLPIYPGAVGDQGLIEHWDGVTWTIVPSTVEPSPGGGFLYGIECLSAIDCWASGAVTDTSGQGSGVLMEQWDGSEWTDVSDTVPVPDGSSGGVMLSSISCVGMSSCWAVGSYGTFGGGGGNGFQPQSLVEYWNGSSWSIEPSPEVGPIDLLNSVSCIAGVGCAAVGTTAIGGTGNDPGLRSFVEQMTFPPASSQGYLLAARDGGVFAYGTATFHGSMGGQHLNAPIVGTASTPDGNGYWLVASDGGVFSFGDATFSGSMGGRRLNAPIVGMAPTSDGHGYWLVASDGGVFSFGDASFAGSMGGTPLNKPVVGMASGASGGYWLVASDGGIFSFGTNFYGSTGSLHIAKPITGMAASADGRGYWLVAGDGGVFSYGDAAYHGSVPGQGIGGQPGVVGMTATPDGQGYWLTGSSGAVYSYGDATFLGAPTATHLVAPLTGIAESP
jgi:hypothetical protein